MERINNRLFECFHYGKDWQETFGIFSSRKELNTDIWNDFIKEWIDNRLLECFHHGMDWQQTFRNVFIKERIVRELILEYFHHEKDWQTFGMISPWNGLTMDFWNVSLWKGLTTHFWNVFTMERIDCRLLESFYILVIIASSFPFVCFLFFLNLEKEKLT